MMIESQRLVLSGQQRTLYDALYSKEKRLAIMYYGALTVLEHNDNPDRIALAAHGIREVMEKLPRYLSLPTEAQPRSIEKLRSLNVVWERTLKRSKCHDTGKWAGTIDKSLETLLSEIGGFFLWLKEQIPKRKESTARVLRGLDTLGRALPGPIEKLRIQQWDEIQQFFIGVSHHQRDSTDGEFASWLAVLETFLLEQLSPRTFEDHEKIDAIIREGEGT